jgi:hypothetical protein
MQGGQIATISEDMDVDIDLLGGTCEGAWTVSAAYAFFLAMRGPILARAVK